jgi:hypothetical protein
VGTADGGPPAAAIRRSQMVRLETSRGWVSSRTTQTTTVPPAGYARPRTSFGALEEPRHAEGACGISACRGRSRRTCGQGSGLTGGCLHSGYVNASWLPAGLAASPFHVTRAHEAGVPWWRLREPHLVRPTRSVRAATAPTTVEERARAFQLALPDDMAFSHVTAAQLWGLSLPGGLEDQNQLDVMRPSERNRIRRSGCRGHRGLERRKVATLRGIRLTGLADTWVDLAELSQTPLLLEDLVVLGDEVATRLVGPPEPGTDVADSSVGLAALRAALDGRARPRGARLLSRALQLVRAPVRSHMETRARLMFLRAGFPEPRVNLPVHGRDGGWLLEGDLVWEDAHVVGEYQGRDHASIRRRSYDSSRSVTAGDEGWRVLEIYAEDVYNPPRRRACLARFARELDLELGALTIT